jgi:hypothetical protein
LQLNQRLDAQSAVKVGVSYQIKKARGKEMKAKMIATISNLGNALANAPRPVLYFLIAFHGNWNR